MKVIQTDRTHSWLQWPVTIDDVTAPNLHLTIKFFGQAAISPEGVAEALRKNFIPDITSLDPEALQKQIDWKPTKFAELIHVMEITRCPDFFRTAHDAFAIIRDDFSPWRPHITVPKNFYSWTSGLSIYPYDVNLKFGAVELYLAKDE